MHNRFSTTTWAAGSAKTIPADSTVQTRSLTRNDTDWVTFTSTASLLYVIDVACSSSTTFLPLPGAQKVGGGHGAYVRRHVFPRLGTERPDRRPWRGLNRDGFQQIAV
jgi:hypothetical protein